MPGDILLQVNDINVSRTQAKAVKKLIRFEMNFNFQIIFKILNRNLPLPITLQLYRRSIPSSTSIKIDKIVLNSVDQHEPLNNNFFSIDRPYSSSDCLLPKPILMNIDHQQSLLMSPINRKISEQSDGSESGVGSESNPYSDGDQENRLVCHFHI
jgi:hypothetical protein